ncbi:MAG: hypothetical protein WCJ97_01705 [Phycisphaerae bacterium]
MARTPPFRLASGDLVLQRTGARAWVLLPGFALLLMLVLFFLTAQHTPLLLYTLAYKSLILVPVLVAALLLGMFLTAPIAKDAWLQESPWPEAYRVVLSMALGFGGLGLGTMLLGSMKALQGIGPIIMLGLAGTLGIYPLILWYRSRKTRLWSQPVNWDQGLFLLTAIPIAALLAVLVIPPGFLWVSEGRGYDVITYHLQLPREYLQNNSTAPLHHNVYSFMPENMEMLFVLLMRLVQGPAEGVSYLYAVVPSQMLHAGFMLLTAAALALMPTPMTLWTRVVAVLLFLSTPWVIVTGALAYNEGGVLLCLVLALGIIFSGARGFWPTLMVGVLCGFSVGYKLPAVMMVVVPVIMILFFRGRWRAVLGVLLLTGLVYAPWAIRSSVATATPQQRGNPVFPLFAGTLGQGHWTDAQVVKWERGHGHQPSEFGPRGHIKAFTRQTLLDEQWSPGLARIAGWFSGMPQSDTFPSRSLRIGVIFILLPLGLLAAIPRGVGRWCFTILVVQICLWVYLTHMQARFLLPALIPAAILLGYTAEIATAWRTLITSVLLVHVLGSALFIWTAAGILLGYPEDYVKYLIGQTATIRVPEVFATEPLPHWPLQRKTLLVGPPRLCPLYVPGEVIYNTTFDRNETFDLVESYTKVGGERSAELMAKLGIDLVIMDWYEISRQYLTYGFDEKFFKDRENVLHYLNRGGATLAPENFNIIRGLTVLKVSDFPPARAGQTPSAPPEPATQPIFIPSSEPANTP